MSKKSTSSNAFDINEQTSKHAVYKNIRVLNSNGTTKGTERVRVNTRPVSDLYSDKFNPSNTWMPNNKATYNHNYADNDFPNLNSIVDKLNRTVNLYESGSGGLTQDYNNLIKKYNRFKVPQPNIELQNAYAHVFFTRPECNVIAVDRTDGRYGDLHTQFKKDSLFDLAFKSDPNMVRELSSLYGPNGASGHKFNFLLSNAAKGFALNDEEIQSDSYGKTYTGYKISYGKNNVESRTAGNFQITYGDDRDLHIYRLHKLWVEYISGVYRGRYRPRDEYIMNKVIDYSCSVYYIMTDEGGERILFWSKYYGVFPVSIPSSQYSWEADNLLRPTQLTISYNYSYKEDYNPFSMTEFNLNAGVSTKAGTNNLIYIPLYDPKLFHTGTTWVGAPFIEKVNKSSSSSFDYYLRFRA